MYKRQGHFYAKAFLVMSFDSLRSRFDKQENFRKRQKMPPQNNLVAGVRKMSMNEIVPIAVLKLNIESSEFFSPSFNILLVW